MADINVERKSRPIWPMILAALAVLLLLWLVFAFLDNDDEVETAAVVPAAGVVGEPAPAAAGPAPAAATPVMPPPPTEADTTSVPVTVIVGGPATYLGRPVVGIGRVTEVVSDRGFWLEQGGQRIFAVIAKTPQMENEVNVNAGQRVGVAGIVYDNVTADQIPGGLEPDARQIIANEPAFLYVPAQNIRLLGPDEG